MERLTPAAGTNPLGGPVVHLDVTGSTNDRARELVTAGAAGGTVVLAEEQTAGRGRQGRKWLSPRGRALTLSVVVRAGADALELLPLVAAVAVCEACEDVAPVRCTLKWPNDVWIDERKVAGVLIESRPRERWAVLGIGLNVATTSEELGDLARTAISLAISSGRSVSRERALQALLERLAERLETGPGELLASYRARDALDGRRIAWTAGGGRLEGEAGGIDAQGSLVVFTADGERHTLSAGEVHLVRSG